MKAVYLSDLLKNEKYEAIPNACKETLISSVERLPFMSTRSYDSILQKQKVYDCYVDIVGSLFDLYLEIQRCMEEKK